MAVTISCQAANLMPPEEYSQLARDIYKEMIESKSGFSTGSTTPMYLTPDVGSEQMAKLMGFALVLVAVLMAGALLGWIVSRFVRTVGLSFFDRLLGAGFGLLKGVFIVITILTAVAAFGPRAQGNKPPEPVLHSRIAPYIVEASRASVALAPMELKGAFHERYSELKSDLKEYARTRLARIRPTNERRL
ncbi:MAG TPA: CvpA family protein [Bryobacteraceae bacterium]|nr:CvpA family protein [Bryobacteraceae bacterium]